MSSGIAIYNKIKEYITEVEQCMDEKERLETDNQSLLLGAESCLAIAEQILIEFGEISEVSQDRDSNLKNDLS